MRDADASPTHTQSRDGTFWTTVNAAEALPGVVTPLTWAMYTVVSELSTRGAFCDMGVLAASDVRLPPRADEQFVAVFHGRAAINVDQFRAMADRVPRQSGDALEKQLFNTVRPDAVSKKTRARYAAVALKVPGTAARVGSRLRTLESEADSWWRGVTAPGAIPTVEIAAQTFATAQTLFTRIYRSQVVASMLATATVQRLTERLAATGKAGLETRLLTGGSALHEMRVMVDLWALSRDELPMAMFLDRHGFHGPNEGELAARSWRVDSGPIDSLASRYKAMDESQSPTAVHARRKEEAQRAEHELRSGLSTRELANVRLLLRLARLYVPLREVGRASALRAIDGARTASRLVGEVLVQRGALDSVDDVFFLVPEELFDLADGNVAEHRDRVHVRRDEHERNLRLSLPESWTGTPESTVTDEAQISSDNAIALALPLRGVPVSPGIVEGRVRVCMSADDGFALEPGEVLVCPFTDPGWASLFLIAGALVIDVGGPLSHGAIVARELGVPAVINTRIGTRVLKTGDLVRVDSVVGTVERLDS